MTHFLKKQVQASYQHFLPTLEGGTISPCMCRDNHLTAAGTQGCRKVKKLALFLFLQQRTAAL